MITKAVAVSGTVGKQPFAITDDPVRLIGYHMYAPTSAASVVIRSGATSGDVISESSLPLNASPDPVIFPRGGVRFDKGMHVKVLGVGSTCYLYIE